eukprot:g31238.t1
MAKCGFLWVSLFYLCYLLLGAVVVSLIEQPYERSLREKLRSLKLGLLNGNPCLAEPDLERFLVRALEARRYGVSVFGNTSHTNWDFASAFFFAGTLVTTVDKPHNVGTGHSAQQVHTDPLKDIPPRPIPLLYSCNPAFHMANPAGYTSLDSV